MKHVNVEHISRREEIELSLDNSFTPPLFLMISNNEKINHYHHANGENMSHLSLLMLKIDSVSQKTEMSNMTSALFLHLPPSVK